MLDKVLEYIKSRQVVNIRRLKKDLDISEEEWNLILLQLRDLGYIIEKNLIGSSRCVSCSYAKTCSQGCINIGDIYIVISNSGKP